MTRQVRPCVPSASRCVPQRKDEGASPVSPPLGGRARRDADAVGECVPIVAALYVATGGVYFGLAGVDPWDEKRDARQYAGPHRVVAHPPCQRWCALAHLNQHLHGYKIGDDGGCFKHALWAVRTFGGVLEHPAYSIAWTHFGLPRPQHGGWKRDMFDGGWVCEVSQVAYGHRARKRTWLYAFGVEPQPLQWKVGGATAKVSRLRRPKKGGGYVPDSYRNGMRVEDGESKATPLGFRDALLAIARL